MELNLSKFRSESLKAHNAYRKVHGAEPLVETGKLNEYAQIWAQGLADSGKFKHSYGAYGENIAYKGQSRVPTGYEITKMWYDEEKDYDYDTQKGIGGRVIGHFTQVVWKGTTKVGFGIAKSSKFPRKYYAVASYDKPGNFTGQYGENVGRKTGEPDFTEEDESEPAAPATTDEKDGEDEEKIEEDADEDDVEDGDEVEEEEETVEDGIVRNARGEKKPNQLSRTVMKAFRERFKRQVNRFRDDVGVPGLTRQKLFQKLAQKKANAIIEGKPKSNDEEDGVKKVLKWTSNPLEAGDEAARNIKRQAQDPQWSDLYSSLMSKDFTAIGVGVSCPSGDGNEMAFMYIYMG